jgi:hypothetical protein
MYTGASTLTVTKGSNEIYDARFSINTIILRLDGALILGQNNNLYILGEVGTSGDKIRVMVMGYEAGINGAGV